MDLEKNLRERCHVISGGDGDRFVGVKADTDDAMIYFPIGYQLPEDDIMFIFCFDCTRGG